jgi:hypothetical protein
MPRVSTKLEKWPQVNIRLEPSLYRALNKALADPLYLQLPKGAVQNFITTAIRHELERRGLPCAIAFSESTPSPSQKSETEFF